MQGALLRVLVGVAVTTGVLPAVSSAQVLDVPPVQVPSVSVPPVALPAPLPQVSTPQVTTPPVTVPGIRVDAPLPSAPVQAPLPAAPRPAAPVVDSASSLVGPDRAADTAASGTPSASSGQAPSGTVAAAGTPSASPARGGRVARAAAVPGGRGVLGTSYRSPGRLVRALSACVRGLPERQERLLVLRYGLGAAAVHPDRAVARTLRLSRGEYTSVRRRALRGLVRHARAGGCRDAAPGSAAPVIAFGDGGEVRPVVGVSGSRSSSRGAEIAVRGAHASGGSESLDEDVDELATPLALDADEPASSLFGVLMLAAVIAVLALIALRGVKAGLKP
jgi:hypothetical protein